MAKRKLSSYEPKQRFRVPKIYPKMQRLLGHTSDVPALCTVCSRASVGIGVPISRSGPFAGWVCDDPVCFEVIKPVMHTPPKSLTALESIAVASAAGAVVEDVSRAVLSALWQAGIDNISEITDEQFAAALSNLAAEPAFAEAARTMLIEYAETVRTNVDNYVAPF